MLNGLGGILFQNANTLNVKYTTLPMDGIWIKFSNHLVLYIIGSISNKTDNL